MFSGHKNKKRAEALIADWVRYREIVATRLGAPDVTPDEERRFLALKGRIVENLTAVVAGVSPRGPGQDVQNHQRGITEFLNRHALLGAEAVPTEAEREEFSREWHRLFLFLNRLKGLLGREIAKAAATRPKPQTPPLRWRLSGVGWFVRFALRLALVVAAIWLLAVLLPWERITGARFHPGKITGSLPHSWGGARDAVSGFHLPTLGGVFSPVVERYGPEVTTILVAVLLVAIGYWIFIRMK